MALGILAKKITNAFKFHKEAKGDMDKLKKNFIDDGWTFTQDSTPTTTDIKTTSQKKETSNEKSIAKAKRTGRRYTILTSSKGLTSNFKTTKKTLLGG